MRVTNFWFEPLTFFGAVFMLMSAVGSVADFVYSKDRNLLVTVIAAGIFLLLAVFFLRMSRQIGECQRKSRESRAAKMTDQYNDGSPSSQT